MPRRIDRDVAEEDEEGEEKKQDATTPRSDRRRRPAPPPPIAASSPSRPSGGGGGGGGGGGVGGGGASALLGLFERPGGGPPRPAPGDDGGGGGAAVVADNVVGGPKIDGPAACDPPAPDPSRPAEPDDVTVRAGRWPAPRRSVSGPAGESERLRSGILPSGGYMSFRVSSSASRNDWDEEIGAGAGVVAAARGGDYRSVPTCVSWDAADDLSTASGANDGAAGTGRLDRLRAARRRAYRFFKRVASRCSSASPPSVLIGSTTSVLYHCVFSLAMASSVTRRHAPVPSVSLLGPMAKMTALGVIATSPLLIYSLGPEAPALYPSADLFLAPFMSQLGRTVDETLHRKRMESESSELVDDTAVFLGTFSVLAGLGMLLSSALCVLAARVKLANLGAFLPHAVICGFFSSIGVMVWTLSFSVDNGGAKIEDVLLGSSLGGGTPGLGRSLYHHLPSFAGGVAMKVLCSRSPVFLPVSIVCIVVVAYAAMFLTGTTLAEAQMNGWFWTTEELVGGRLHGMVGYAAGPPAPFGIAHSLFRQQVDFDAVRAGLPTVVAMSLIYALRCSLHAVALKKLATILTKKKSIASSDGDVQTRMRAYSGGGTFNMSFGDISFDDGYDGHDNAAAQSTHSLKEDGGHQPTLDNLRTLLWYGLGHLTSAVVGGFSAMPAFAVGAVLFELGVEGLAPQYGGIAILIFCYMTDFSVITYIPKAVFSSLLVLCFLEFIWKWFVQSYSKTKRIWEWLVVPAIVVVAFMVPLLEAVVLGVAASTFIFVGAFYGSGVVKFASTGLMIRSTVDRMEEDADVLDGKGDLIQILVLQNYFFFGNASSCMQYIQTMFEKPTIDAPVDFQLPPEPKFVILDFTLVTGMDTSSVDIIAEVVTLCKEEKCTLLLSGLSRDFKSTLACGGVKPTPNVLLYCHDLDSALGKAEDCVINETRKVRRTYAFGNFELGAANGFLKALAQIETHQGISCMNLRGLEKYTTALTVLPRQFLCGSDLNPSGGIVPDSKRGLFFIEEGLLQIERDPSCSYSLTRHFSKRSKKDLSQINARSATVGNMSNLLKVTKSLPPRSFRLAKIGPGWVIGAVEGCSGIRNPGLYSAITKCRLHHISYSALPQIERDDPLLALNLFKLLAHIVSRRQISAIEQLGNLHSIMTSDPITQARSRLTMGAITGAVQCMCDK